MVYLIRKPYRPVDTENHMAESSEKHKVPDGLRPLLEALVRETLRAQPVDLISFSILFFNVLQKHRKQNNAEDVLKDPALYESFKSDLQKQIEANLQDFGLSKKQAKVPHTECNSLLDEKKDLKKFVSICLQYANSCYPTDVIDSVIERDVIEDRAATKIQAEIRGFLIRRHLQQERKEGNEAAKKIQAHIRGYLTRKHLNEVGISHKHSTVSHLRNALQECDAIYRKVREDFYSELNGSQDIEEIFLLRLLLMAVHTCTWESSKNYVTQGVG
ncbi:unnamed protein product [Litomosoides sigmodontis]|uniref:RIIa domain-containing protein n=1 Tax=Litomosoides sigmodontis TaxID=42156 RepID=A0A3P7KDV8_LITSI|nr:unnamed protein product [Litomosoides sigmodontis]